MDWYHAKQHLWDVATLIHPNDDAQSAAWIHIQSDLLYQGKINDLVATCTTWAHPQSPKFQDELDRKLNYFRNHDARMQYADFQRAGLPIGSGVIESAGKQYKHRLAASGMRWSRAGAERLLPFIDARLSHRLDPLLQHCFPF